LDVAQNHFEVVTTNVTDVQKPSWQRERVDDSMPHGFLLSNDDEQYFNHVNGVCIVVVLTISAFFFFFAQLKQFSSWKNNHPESKGQKRVTLFLIIKLGKAPLSLKTPLDKAYDTEKSPVDILYEPLKHQVLQILFDL
jgi:hypothetical protein